MTNAIDKIRSRSPISNLISAIIIIFIIECSAGSAFAAGPAVTLTAGTDYNQGSYSLGWSFTANGNLPITALGFYDSDSNGLTENHDVGIYDLSCNLIAHTTVTPSDALVGRFRYHALSSPATLVSGQTYYIAAVNGTEAYDIFVPDIGASSDISFIGFSIYGNTQSTSTLQCPNGSQSPGAQGDFGPNFYVGTLPPEIPASGNVNDPNKRNTALSMFCNRSGPTLSTAKCTVSIADTGAPPRILPTGTINWEARDGFFPESAQCNITQVALSPGIGSCEVEFTVPTGFSIGTKFPIDASYDGDTTFNGSNTSHKLIKPACISTDPAHPCPDSIGLSFDQYPTILKAKIKTLVSCGGTPAAAGMSMVHPRFGGIVGAVCSITGSINLDVQELFKQLSFDEAKAIGEQIDDSAAQKDTLLYYLQKANQVQTEERWKILQDTQKVLFELQQDVTKNKPEVRREVSPYSKWDQYIQQLHYFERTTTKPKFDKSLKSEILTFDVKPNKTKSATFKLPKRVQTLIAIYKKAGVSTMPLNVKISAKQKKRKGKASVNESVDFILK